MFWTSEERNNMWKNDQSRFAEIAHNYLCCDVPTVTQCMFCTKNYSCKNRKEVLKALSNYKEWGDKISEQNIDEDVDVEYHSFVKEITSIIRKCDYNFEKAGGSTRHWVRDHLIPELKLNGFKIIKL